ncbi:hypothetical protein Krac_11527 [Ktedonobacter racemifer DSM 44963]|uniref:Uncharacterized protein n=1 Tax=Ktedonobacter racemifer DSM 44963 TaxID=485913 RepID=D6TCC1_KTERA|nr:hypothetical protein Krac_11527 [Ktedonobacter racemifer DSM 44963]
MDCQAITGSLLFSGVINGRSMSCLVKQLYTSKTSTPN